MPLSSGTLPIHGGPPWISTASTFPQLHSPAGSSAPCTAGRAQLRSILPLVQPRLAMANWTLLLRGSCDKLVKWPAVKRVFNQVQPWVPYAGSNRSTGRPDCDSLNLGTAALSPSHTMPLVGCTGCILEMTERCHIPDII
jgi:hypothetical protein